MHTTSLDFVEPLVSRYSLSRQGASVSSKYGNRETSCSLICFLSLKQSFSCLRHSHMEKTCHTENHRILLPLFCRRHNSQRVACFLELHDQRRVGFALQFSLLQVMRWHYLLFCPSCSAMSLLCFRTHSSQRASRRWNDEHRAPASKVIVAKVWITSSRLVLERE